MEKDKDVYEIKLKKIEQYHSYYFIIEGKILFHTFKHSFVFSDETRLFEKVNTLNIRYARPFLPKK